MNQQQTIFEQQVIIDHEVFESTDIVRILKVDNSDLLLTYSTALKPLMKIKLFESNIFKSQQVINDFIKKEGLSRAFKIDLEEILKNQPIDTNQTLSEINKFLQTIEIYLKGECASEPSESQIIENMELYYESRRLQNNLKTIIDNQINSKI